MIYKSLHLSELAEIGDGNHSSNYPKSSEMLKDGIPFLRSGNIQDGKIIDDNLKFISPEKHQILKKGHVKTGDVLFTNRGEIGKIGIVDERFNNANLNSQVAWIRVGNQLYNRFLYYYLSSPSVKKFFLKSKTGTAVQQITIKQLKSLMINIPPFSEQQRIVTKLDKAFAEIDKTVKLMHKKEIEIIKLNSSFLKNEFSEEKYSSKIYKILPFEKCLKKIKTTPKILKKDYLNAGSFPIVSQEASLVNGYSNNTEVVFNLKKPVIVFGDHTRVLKYIDFDFIKGADGTKIFLPINDLETKYLYYLLKYKMPKGVGYARHYYLLKEIQIIIPSLEEQRRIITKLDKFNLELNKALEYVKKNKQNYLALKSSILSENYKVNQYE